MTVSEKAKLFFKRCQATAQFFKQSGKYIVFEIEETDVVRAQILALLERFVGIAHYNALLATEITDAIMGLIEENNGQLLIGRMAKHFGPLIELVVHKAGILFGVAGLWELNYKFLAHRLDVDVFEERRDQIRTVNLSEVSREIRRRYPRIRVDFTFQSDLRHCLFHGNFQQLRELLEPRLNPEEREELNSGVVALHLGQERREPLGADDEMTNEEAMNLGPFFWFLSGGNSKLIEFTAREFEHGLAQIEKLIIIKGVDFGETQGIFNQLAVDGQRLTQAQENALFAQHRRFAPHSVDTQESYIRRVSNAFDLQ